MSTWTPTTLHLGVCPVRVLRLSLEPLFQPWGSAAVELDHFLPDVIILHTLGYGLRLDLVTENSSWLRQPRVPAHGASRCFLQALPLGVTCPFTTRGEGRRIAGSRSPPG